MLLGAVLPGADDELDLLRRAVHALALGARGLDVRDDDGECRADAEGARHGHLAVHARDELLYDGESEAGASVASATPRLHVGVRDLLLVPGRDSAAGVRHGYREPLVVVVGHRDLDLALLRVLHCVAHEVAEDLSDAVGVYLDERHRGDARDELDALLLERLDVCREDVLRELGAVRRDRHELHRPRLELGEVQDVADELLEHVRARDDRGERLLAVLVSLVAELEELAVADDRVERRADVVGDGREEEALRGLDLLRALERLVQLRLVDGDAEDAEPPGRIARLHLLHAEVAHAPVGRAARLQELLRLSLGVLQYLLLPRGERVGRLLVVEVVVGETDDLRKGRDAHVLHERLVAVDETPRRVLDEHEARHRVHGPPEVRGHVLLLFFLLHRPPLSP